jgi:hypothetical protein
MTPFGNKACRAKRSLWLSEGLQHLGSRSILPRTTQTSIFVHAPQFADLAASTLYATNGRRIPLSARRLFRLRCEAPEIHVRRRGEIGKDRPHCDCLVELLRVYLVERIVGGVVGVEIIKPVLAGAGPRLG